MDTSIPNRFSKYSEEFFRIAVDFSPNMVDGEVINPVLSDIVAQDDAGTICTNDVIDISTKAVSDDVRLNVVVQNGNPGKSYLLKFKAHIAVDKFLRADVIMNVTSE